MLAKSEAAANVAQLWFYRTLLMARVLVAAGLALAFFLSNENSFWTSQAQRLLSDYLWKEGKVPPTRKLTIRDVDRDELPIAARWQTS